jgi:sec-independent protein translocase protein TatC
MFESMKPHLAELRTRLAISVAAVLVMFMVAFVFHNPILTWVTQPLNDALTQVKAIVEQREDGTWKVQHKEANRTVHQQTDANASASVPSTSAGQATRLHDRLSAASRLLAKRHRDATDTQLASLLRDAAASAKALAASLEHNRTAHVSKAANSFWGSITTHQVGGAFFVALKVSFFAGLLFAMPIILWQLWLFIAPGLYDNEKRMVLPFVIGGSVMFTLGVLFAYYVVTPFGFQFLITFGSFLYTPLINIEDYVGFFTKILLGFGIAFELPVVAYFLGMLGLITDQTLIRFFKYAIVMIFILAALLTPPDVLTQVLMAAPLILLYGASIIILRFVNPEEPEEEEPSKPSPTPEETPPATLPEQKKPRSPHETDTPFDENGDPGDDFDFGDDDPDPTR